MEKPNQNPLVRLYRAFFYSIDGLRACYRSEQAFRLELLACLILAPIPFFLDLSSAQIALMIFSLAFVLIVELINSAIEAIVDRISIEQHELSKKAKDTGSAAVLLASLSAAAVWGMILFL